MRRFTLKTVALALLGLFGAHGVCVQAQTWTGSSPSEANGKTVYLYNVGAKKFLGKGGRWGTEANLNYEGVPFKLTYSSSTFTLQSLVKAQGSTTNGYLTICDGKNSTHDTGNFFVDRNDNANNVFTATAVTTTGKNVYTLKITPTYSSSSSIYNTTFYMAGLPDNTIGSQEVIDSTYLAYSQWMIVTEDERLQAFQKADAGHAQPVNATFLMYDFDFARNDNSISYWKTTDGTSLSYYSSSLRLPSYAQGGTVYTYTHTYTSKHAATYKNNSGSISSSDTTHTASFTVTTLMPAVKMPQTVTASCGGATKTSSYVTYTHSAEEVTYTLTSTSYTSTTASSYTYYVGNGYIDGDGNTSVTTNYWCDAITGQEVDQESEKNRQAAYGGNWTANIHGGNGAVTQQLTTDNMVRKGYYRVSCKAFTTATNGIVVLYAGDDVMATSEDSGSSETYGQTNIARITEAPATYVAASQLLQSEGTTYDASVTVYADTENPLKFGVSVSGANGGAWTCFDDFAIEYLGDPQTVLVLDEDQTGGEYIKNQATKDGDELKTVKLYLHRTMNANKWNSLVLPVSLTVGQVKSAFGDDLRISEFKGANDQDRPETIIFSKISANRDNSNDTAIVAGRLYLVKPTTAMPINQPEVKFAVPGQTDSVSITSYYTIVGVTYAHAADVKGIDYSAKVYGDKGKETYDGAEDAIQFVGTYVKLGDNNKIPQNSYVLNGNNQGGTAGVWYYRTKETASKGFRGWLQPVNGTATKSLTYEIDGIAETIDGNTTGIGEIISNPNAINGNIYNLNGQLVRRNATSLEGLASGIYVAGGKKYVVK